MDKKIVAEMDQKVIDQQNTLEKAGVPGFYITTNPQVNLKCSLLVLIKNTGGSKTTNTAKGCSLVLCNEVKFPAGGITLCFISGADNANEPS